MGTVLWEMHLDVMDVRILAYQPFNQERRSGYWQMMCSCRKKRSFSSFYMSILALSLFCRTGFLVMNLAKKEKKLIIS